MQNNQIIKLIKATIFSIIVAFLISIIICNISIKFGKEKFLMATNFIDMLTVSSSSEMENRLDPVLKEYEAEEKEESGTVLLNCPSYGEKYATIKISSINLELPIYYGKTLDLLKNGIGHDNDSYFPGEGGSIILMGHNFKKLLGNLPKVKVGDVIQVSTNYGEFEYSIYDAKIVNEYDIDEVPIQDKEEMLMIYTCWPINNIGYANERYVVYAK